MPLTASTFERDVVAESTNPSTDPLLSDADRAAVSGVDAPFAVDLVHRLRFTEEAFRVENPVLRDVLPVSGRGPNRLLVFLDGGCAEAWPDLAEQVAHYAEAHRDRLLLAGPTLTVPGGERAKNDRSVYETAIEAINDAGLCRQSFVLVIGGGAVLDAVGFAAATAHRGVRLIRLPSTTLAQADGGLGVKNGINAFGKKNFLGTFATPWAVINDRSVLRTLSDADFRCGFSEAVKVGLIKDAALFEEVAQEAGRVCRRDDAVTDSIIRRSAELHLQHIVARGDPFELTESRPLDFGHWSAHKLEQMTGFTLRHGEAVAIGVALDVVYSSLLGMLDPMAAESILRCLHELGFDLHHPVMADTSELLQGLTEFREHLGGELTIVLLRDIGEPVDVHEMDEVLVARAIEHLAAWA